MLSSVLSNQLPTEKAPEHSPEEAALIMRLRVFVTMRWFAILGVIIATLVASLGFHIGFPTLPVYIVCAFMTLYNLVLLGQVRITGGIENPFIFFYVFHIIAASIVLPYKTVYRLATLAILMVGLLVGLEYAGIIPHVNLEGFVTFTGIISHTDVPKILSACDILVLPHTPLGLALQWKGQPFY